jgi:hypothetical protein
MKALRVACGVDAEFYQADYTGPCVIVQGSPQLTCSSTLQNSKSTCLSPRCSGFNPCSFCDCLKRFQNDSPMDVAISY